MKFDIGQLSTEYSAKVIWTRNIDENYIEHEYSRAHEWFFDGGVTVPASSSPHVVPLPYSVETNVDPEEAFVASLSSCHMLFFLSIAAKKKFIIEEYVDNPIGVMGGDKERKVSMTKVTLYPKVTFSMPNQPSLEQIERMHNLAHEQCFIANSVKTKITIEIVS